MSKLTPEGETKLAEIANRHQVSVEAARAMLEALGRGGGTMAQFSHPELGGSGQWLAGGMIMIGDMFNTQLKAKVDALASELAGMMASAPTAAGVFAPMSEASGQASYQQGQASHQQGQGSYQSQSQGGPGASGGMFTAHASGSTSSGDWWPTDLGRPSSVGAQNDMRYAYFPDKRRLALHRGGRVEVLDTGEHQISGFGQQQGGGDSITLSSQLGTVPLGSLKRVGAPEGAGGNAAGDAPFPGTGPAATPVAEQAAAAANSDMPSDSGALIALLEKLGELREKGFISEDEFASKKAELLKRL